MTFGYGIKYILPNNNEESPTLSSRTFLININLETINNINFY